MKLDEKEIERLVEEVLSERVAVTPIATSILTAAGLAKRLIAGASRRTDLKTLFGKDFPEKFTSKDVAELLGKVTDNNKIKAVVDAMFPENTLKDIDLMKIYFFCRKNLQLLVCIRF